jgi:hypothetical protein
MVTIIVLCGGKMGSVGVLALDVPLWGEAAERELRIFMVV